MHGGVFFFSLFFASAPSTWRLDLLHLACSQVVRSFQHFTSSHCIQYPIFHQHYLRSVNLFAVGSSGIIWTAWSREQAVDAVSPKQSMHPAAPFALCLGRLGIAEGTMDKCMNFCVLSHSPITSFSPFLVPRVHLSYLSFSLCLTGGVLFFDDVATQVIESSMRLSPSRDLISLNKHLFASMISMQLVSC